MLSKSLCLMSRRLPSPRSFWGRGRCAELADGGLIWELGPLFPMPLGLFTMVQGWSLSFFFAE